MDDVVVHGPGGLGRRADGDVLLGGKLEEIRTAAVRLLVWAKKVKGNDHERESVVELGQTPRGENLQGGVAGLPCQLEANLTGENNVSIKPVAPWR